MRKILLAASLILPATGLTFDPAQQDDSLALVRHFKKPAKPLKPFVDGKFEPNEGETVTLMGGTEVYQMQEKPYLEALLHLSFQDKKLRLRNIAWPADTVYRQQRPMFFYTEKGDAREDSIPDSRQKLEPGIFILQFGKMESLDGLDRLEEFRNAYEQLIDSLMKFSPRIVVVNPNRFSESGPAGKLAEKRNQVLEKYRVEIRKIVAKRGLIFSGEETKVIEEIGDTSFSLSNTIVSEVGKKPSKFAAIGSSPEIDILFEKIISKNDLWLQYYRPTNWAFLFGDRQHVPSSRDYKNRQRRWFVEELKKLPALIDEADQAIWDQANRFQK